jgi:hypothetical protein
VAFSNPRQFKKATHGMTSPDADGVNYATPLKVTIAKRFYTCAVIFKPSWFLGRGKVMSLSRAFCLNKAV